MSRHSTRRLPERLQCVGCACRRIDECSCFAGCSEPSHTDTPVHVGISHQIAAMVYPARAVEMTLATAAKIADYRIKNPTEPNLGICDWTDAGLASAVAGHPVKIVAELSIPWRVETWEPDPANPGHGRKKVVR